ncbi:MAG TPA: NAD-dependent 4,6-dehydratase LegB [Anaerolineales bacterium]|nr:NAD-dependent 4,6-dehydratase LegB [Anaerolineales bacterium]
MNSTNVLITGADGFIGSHLVEEMVKAGANVRALAQYNSIGSHGWLEDVNCKNDIEIVIGDVRDGAFCRSLLKGIDIVYHLAALIAIPYSYVAPASYIDTNVKGTLNICQAALDNGVSKVVQISTSEVYGTAKYVPMDENHPLQPQSPYSASKIGADSIALSFHKAFQLPVVLARPFNTYGPRQSARAVIPAVIIQLASGAKTIKLGDVHPTRDFNYVLDTCQGLLLLGDCDAAIGETVNIGSNCEISILDTVKMIMDVLGVRAEIETDEQRLRPQNSEVFRLWCDNTKLRQLTGYAPAYDIRRGLEQTVEWFADPGHLRKYKAGIYNV